MRGTRIPLPMPWIFRKRHHRTQSTTDESVAWLLPFRQPAGTIKRSFGERATTATTATAAAANCCSYLFWPARIAYDCGSGAVCGSQRFWPRTTTIYYYCTYNILIMKITITGRFRWTGNQLVLNIAGLSAMLDRRVFLKGVGVIFILYLNKYNMVSKGEGGWGTCFPFLLP